MTDNSQKMYSIKNSTEEDDDRIYQQNMRNKCGEIFFEDDKFKYYCLFCQEDFGKICIFINHLCTTHLLIEPSLLEDDKSEEVNIDYAKAGDIKDNNELDENYIFYISENEDQKFVTKQNIEDDQISYSKIENDLLQLNEKSENLLNECKVETEIRTAETFKQNIELKKNQCEICFRILSSKRRLQTHKITHIKNTKSTSTLTNTEMKTTESFNQDIQLKKNQCKICFKILSSKRRLQTHKITHIKNTNSTSTLINKFTFPKGEDDKFHCDLCPCSYTRIDSLRRHMENHWGSTNQAKCDICSKILSSKVLLKAHMRVHTGERPHKCDYCPAAFADRTNFDRHLRMHFGDKRYNCNYCDKTFIQSTDKKNHERMVHTKERPYQCEICGKNFFNTVSLKDHKKRHTNTRPFECEICGKRFYNRKLMKDHKISHSNEKPHTCDICSAKFARRKALTQHIKIHSNVKEYVCTICNKAFAQSAGLYSHMKSHIGSLETHSIFTT